MEHDANVLLLRPKTPQRLVVPPLLPKPLKARTCQRKRASVRSTTPSSAILNACRIDLSGHAFVTILIDNSGE